MESSIEILSDDVLLEVFEFLDAKSLKKAALVCRNWNDVISLSPSTMKKLRLKISNINFSSRNQSFEEKIEEVLSLERKFQAIDATLFDLRVHNAAESFVKIINCHGSQIREMVLRDVNFGTSDEFHELLKNVPLLEKLELIQMNFSRKGKPRDIKTVALKKLQSLRVEGSCWTVYQHLIGSQILSLTNTKSLILPSDRECFVNFLKASNKLESLDMDFHAFYRVFEQEIPEKFNFKLKKFKFISVQNLSFVQDSDKNFNKFLISQASSIEELELNMLPLNVVETVLEKLKCLKKLRIHSGSLSSEKEFYDFMKPIESLKEIEAHDEFHHENAAKFLLGICPKLETFKAVYDSTGIISNLLPFIALHNQNLKTLKIESLKVQHEPEVNLKKLQFFHVQTFEDFSILFKFVKENSSIETLSIGSVSKEAFNDENLESLMIETNLKHLKFGGDYKTIQEIYNKIKVDYKKLKSLQLTEVVDGETGASVIFDFPQDPSKFDAKCNFFD